jgi:hypothetical protein
MNKPQRLVRRFPNMPDEIDIAATTRAVKKMDALSGLQMGEGDEFLDCDGDRCMMLGPITRDNRVVIEYLCETKSGAAFYSWFDPNHITSQLADEWRPC